MTTKVVHKLFCDYCTKEILGKWYREKVKIISSSAPNFYRDNAVFKDYHLKCYENLNSRIPKK